MICQEHKYKHKHICCEKYSALYDKLFLTVYYIRHYYGKHTEIILHPTTASNKYFNNSLLLMFLLPVPLS